MSTEALGALPDADTPSDAYACRRQRERSAMIALSVLLLACTFLAIAVGAVHIPLAGLFSGEEALSPLQKMVLMEIRLPRIALAISVGAALALGGAALQGLFRNPLAEPQLIGVSSGAALGAIAMIVLGSGLALPDAVQPYAVSLAAVSGALLVTASLYLVSTRRETLDVSSMLLLGIAINAIAGVGIGLFTWLANDGELRSLTFWSLGSFGAAQWANTLPAMCMIAVSALLLLPASGDLDRLQLGETQARRLGVSVDGLKRRLVFAVAIGVGAAVSVSGIIGFVGLVVPHIARLVVGVHHRLLLWASALLGAVLALLADLGSRTLVAPAEMPVGLLTSALGAPFFLWLVLRLRQL